MIKISYSGYRFPPEIIQHAIWLYLRFTLSFRDVEDLLAERGIMVSYETVRRWVKTPTQTPYDLLGWTAPTASMCQNEVVADPKTKETVRGIY